MKLAKSLLSWLVLACAIGPLAAVAAGETSASGTISTQNISTSETATANSCVEIDLTDKGTLSVEVEGTYTGALSLQRTNRRITWETLTWSTTFTNKAGTQTATIGSGVTGTFSVGNVAGFRKARVCALAAVTGSATVTLYTSIPGGGGGSSGGSTDMTATNTKLDTIDASINASNSQLPAALGVAAAAASLSVTQSTEDAAKQTTISALSKAVDAVAGASDTGIPALVVRDDSLAVLTPADGDYTNLRTNNVGALWVTSGAATSVAIGGNPFRVAAAVKTAWDTTLANGDTADMVADLSGALISKPYSISAMDVSYAAATSGIVNTTTAVTIASAGAGSLRNYLTQLDIMCEALTTATEIAIRDGAGGTVLWRTKVGTAGLPHASFNFTQPKRGTAATLMEVVTLTASGTGACYVNASIYQAL